VVPPPAEPWLLGALKFGRWDYSRCCHSIFHGLECFTSIPQHRHIETWTDVEVRGKPKDQPRFKWRDEAQLLLGFATWLMFDFFRVTAARTLLPRLATSSPNWRRHLWRYPLIGGSSEIIRNRGRFPTGPNLANSKNKTLLDQTMQRWMTFFLRKILGLRWFWEQGTIMILQVKAVLKRSMQFCLQVGTHFRRL